MTVEHQLRQALDVASDIAQQYQISSLELLLASCRSAMSQDEIPVAIVGRFKAGKSRLPKPIHRAFDLAGRSDTGDRRSH